MVVPTFNQADLCEFEGQPELRMEILSHKNKLSPSVKTNGGGEDGQKELCQEASTEMHHLEMRLASNERRGSCGKSSFVFRG